MLNLSFYMWAALFAYGLLAAGLLSRRNRKRHVPLMLSGILVDLGIVVTLEIKRHAVETAFSFSLTAPEQAHIAVSSVATLLYFPVIYLGALRLLGHGGPAARLWHIRIGCTAFFFRSLGLILMFSFLSNSG